MVHYQGFLTDMESEPLDTTVAMTFTLYDSETGTTILWQETQPSCTVRAGLFNVLWGSVNVIPDSVFADTNVWLGITVGGDSEMSPRSRIVSVGYAYRVGTVDGASGGTVKSDLIVEGRGNFGSGNTNAGLFAFVAGQYDTASADYSSVRGGHSNRAFADYSILGGGFDNWIYDTGSSSTVSGGASHFVPGGASTVGGGISHYVGILSTVGGGNNNNASGALATVGGGYGNYAGDYSTVSGGQENLSILSSAVGGGYSNAAGDYSTVSGGYDNSAHGDYCTIGGGWRNTISNYYYDADITISGGHENSATWWGATIGGGYDNTAYAWATVSGGSVNIASGPNGMVPGGVYNTAANTRSFAAGRRAKANHEGSFVWADYWDADFASSAQNQFNIRAIGGTRIYTDSGLTSGVTLAAGGNAWVAVSDSTKKRNIRPVDTKQILEKVSQLPIKQWSYQSQDPNIEHIGPMAQDFWKLFHLGEDSLGISTIDLSGIVLAAIQELKVRTDEIEVLKAEVGQLKALVQNLLAARGQDTIEQTILVDRTQKY